MDLATQQLAMRIPRPLFEPVYRLRGAIEYAGRPRWQGGWNLLTQDPVMAIWARPKDGMTYFVVEGEDQAFEQVELLRIPGHDYAYASWEVYSYSPSIGLNGTAILRPQVYGLSIWTDREKCTVFIDGRVERRPMTPSEAGHFVREHSV